jgi:hypothetical protein
MKKILFTFISWAATPIFAFAQNPPAVPAAPNPAFAPASLQTFFTNLLTFFNTALIPFLFGLAFLIFAYNVIKYFVVGGNNKDAQETAKSVAVYSVLAFVFLTVFWGIVNMLTTSTGLEGCGPVNSDYVQNNTMGPPRPGC